MKGANRISVSSSNLAPTSPWPQNFRPAVNRQPMFPRDMTRRADSACPPTNYHSEFSRFLQRTCFESKRKHRFSIKIAIVGAIMKPCFRSESAQTNFMGLLLLAKPASNILPWMILPRKFIGRNLEQMQVGGCKCYLCAQLQLGANFALTTKLRARGEPSTNVPAGDDSQS